jgi:hypothetical protein
MLQHGSLFNADSPGFSQLHATAQELLQDPRVDTNPAFWGTLHRLVLLGQVELASSLLAHHPVMMTAYEGGMADVVRVSCWCCWERVLVCTCARCASPSLVGTVFTRRLQNQ